MMKNILKKTNQKGSLMVEALALLGLITMVTPVLYKKAAERTTELQDINVATQMRMISSAVDDFLKDNYKEVGDVYPDDTFELSEEDMDKLVGYLPKGFDLDRSRLFDRFDIRVRREEVTDAKGKVHNIYTSAVLAPTTEQLTMMRASKIASMIGSSGGVYRDGMLNGVQGTWTADPVGDYGFDNLDDVRDESLAVISTKAIASAKGDVSSDEVLFRTGDYGDDGNTMQVALRMDGNEINGLTNLIASTTGGNGAGENEIVIGRKEGAGLDAVVKQFADLFVTGSTNIKKNLNVGGDTALSGALNVDGHTTLNNGLDVTNGDTNLKNVNVEGDLIQKGGKVEFNASQITMNSEGPVNITSSNGDVTINAPNGTTNVLGDNVNVNANKNLTLNGGENVYIQRGGETRIELNQDGNTITGDTLFKDGDVTVEQNLNVGGDVTVEGDVILVRPEGEESNVMADWLHAKKGIKIGGQATENTSLGSYFTADLTGTNVKSGTFNVRDNLYVDDSSLALGGTRGTAGNKMNINTTSTFIGYNYASSATERKGFYSSNSSNYISMRNGTERSGADIYMTQAQINLRNYDANNALRSTIKTSSTGEITLTSNKLSDSNAAQAVAVLKLNNQGTVLNSYDGNNAKSFTIDETGLAVFDSLKTLSSSTRSVKPIDETNTKSILQTGAKVAIGRQGIIEVAAPSGATDKGGYIKARRLVSDKEFPTGTMYQGYTHSGGTPTKPYDTYQVNPAYTSVMNDIKLATRGGARLSDILPDYINKGIYVVDNTYRNSAVTQWEGKFLSGVSECKSGTAIDNTCIASPWMGFVPAPQCPKGYAKVISLNPIRWRMSEVFTVYDTASFPTTTAGYRDIIGGDGFKTKFVKPTDPRQAEFELSTGAGDGHSHVPTSGRPLTFQTNTWLNTTVSNLYSSAANSGYTTADLGSAKFRGWHTIMGFIYRPTQYRTLLTELGATGASGNDSVYWNIFPVYAGDMAAVANVYCYFERNDSNTATPSWQWGADTQPVYQYDQLNAYKHGNVKDENWSKAVNDPALGYDDAW